YYEHAHTFSRALPQRGPREPFSLPMRRISLSPFNSLKITPQTKHVGRPLRRRLVSFPHRTHGFLGMVFRATLSYPFSIAAHARSGFPTLRRPAADSSATPPAARSFSKSASFCSAVPCISRNSVSKIFLLVFGSFFFRNIATSLNSNRNFIQQKKTTSF